MSADGLRERGHVVAVVRMLERTYDTDARRAWLAVEPDQLSVVSSTRHVFLFDVNVHQTVLLSHLQNTPSM